MYEIPTPVTIHLIFALFYQLGVWCKDETSIRERGRQLCYFIYFVSFTISMTRQAYITDDKDERVFLILYLTIASVQVYRMWYVLWKRNAIFKNDFGPYYTYNQPEFVHINRKLNFFTKFAKYFVLMCFVAFFLANVQTIANDERPFINVALPLDGLNSEAAFWIEFLFISGGMNLSGITCIYTVLLWYLLFSFVIKLTMLGNQFKNMGNTQLKLSVREQQTLYIKDFTDAIRTHDKINGSAKHKHKANVKS